MDQYSLQHSQSDPPYNCTTRPSAKKKRKGIGVKRLTTRFRKLRRSHTNSHSLDSAIGDILEEDSNGEGMESEDEETGGTGNPARLLPAEGGDDAKCPCCILAVVAISKGQSFYTDSPTTTTSPPSDLPILPNTIATSSNNLLRKLPSPTNQETSSDANLEALTRDLPSPPPVGAQTRDYFTSKHTSQQTSSKTSTPFELETSSMHSTGGLVPAPGSLLPKLSKPCLGHVHVGAQPQHITTLSKVINRTKRKQNNDPMANLIPDRRPVVHHGDTVDSSYAVVVDPNQQGVHISPTPIATRELELPEVPRFKKTPRTYVFMQCRPSSLLSSAFNMTRSMSPPPQPLSRKEKKAEREREKEKEKEEKRERERERERAALGNGIVPPSFMHFVFVRVTDTGTVLIYPLMSGPKELVCLEYFNLATTIESSVQTSTNPLSPQSATENLPTSYQSLEQLRRQKAMDREMAEIVASLSSEGVGFSSGFGATGEGWEMFEHVGGIRLREVGEWTEEGVGTVFEMADSIGRKSLILRARTTRESREFLNTLRFLRDGRGRWQVDDWARNKDSDMEELSRVDGEFLCRILCFGHTTDNEGRCLRKRDTKNNTQQSQCDPERNLYEFLANNINVESGWSSSPSRRSYEMYLVLCILFMFSVGHFCQSHLLDTSLPLLSLESELVEQADAFELIDQLARNISLYEIKISDLRGNLEERTRFIAEYIEKLGESEGDIKVCAGLAFHAGRRALNETLSHSRNRITSEMLESLGATHASTAELVVRLDNVKSRIRRRAEILHKYQLLLEALRAQVELQQRGSRGLFPGWEWAVGTAVTFLVVLLAALLHWWSIRGGK
ncbi:hypothetical protein BC938DRAFT_483762 [Jimgerdemannia flammicorona]|uniref:Uncharacterized protein n=1 Tax=Jimgerdemannia flammicorona TaxID=994334 RepID=A0A433QB73_9FUNG|nr:hypothetical protein BC938DRAFT_483762 [Jimgerdemannia flammicorona]